MGGRLSRGESRPDSGGVRGAAWAVVAMAVVLVIIFPWAALGLALLGALAAHGLAANDARLAASFVALAAAIVLVTGFEGVFG